MDKFAFHIFSDDRFMDLTLYQYGYEKCQPLHSFGPAVRNHYLFHYIVSGKGTLSVGPTIMYPGNIRSRAAPAFSSSPEGSPPTPRTFTIRGNTAGSSSTV